MIGIFRYLPKLHRCTVRGSLELLNMITDEANKKKVQEAPKTAQEMAEGGPQTAYGRPKKASRRPRKPIATSAIAKKGVRIRFCRSVCLHYRCAGGTS